MIADLVWADEHRLAVVGFPFKSWGGASWTLAVLASLKLGTTCPAQGGATRRAAASAGAPAGTAGASAGAAAGSSTVFLGADSPAAAVAVVFLVKTPETSLPISVNPGGTLAEL